MFNLVSIDPGLASGFSWWLYTPDEPASLVQGWQVPGGYPAFAQWLDENVPYFQGIDARFICEKWIPYPTPGHSPTLNSTYPLVLEGVLIDRGIMPAEYPHLNWRRSSEQYWVAGRRADDKRAKQKAWLKDRTDLYRTAGQLGVKHKDSEDYLSSVFHALSFLRSINHRPTVDFYWRGE